MIRISTIAVESIRRIGWETGPSRLSTISFSFARVDVMDALHTQEKLTSAECHGCCSF